MPTKIIIISCVGLLFVAAGLFLAGVYIWPTPPVSPSGEETATTRGGGTSGERVANIPRLQPLPELANKYGELLAKLDAQKLTFAEVSSDEGENGTFRALYKNEAGEYAKFFPGELFVVHVARTDLNGDGFEDALVYVDAPGWCGASGGCQLDIYKNSNGWKRIGSTLAVGDVAVANTKKTNGYADLYLSVPGELGYQTNVVQHLFSDSNEYQPQKVVAVWNGVSFLLAR